MKKFSKKVKNILIIAFALICVFALTITAIVVGKNKRIKENVEQNKQAQLFLNSQKSFASAISSNEDNSQNVYYADGTKLSELANKKFSFVQGNILVMQWIGLYGGCRDDTAAVWKMERVQPWCGDGAGIAAGKWKWCRGAGNNGEMVTVEMEWRCSGRGW